MLRGVESPGGQRKLIQLADESAVQASTKSIEVGHGAEIVVHTAPSGILADRLRFLRAQLRVLWSTEKLKTLLVTSPSPQDGKSTIALNLATVLAEHGARRVLLVEADLHHPTVTERLCLGNKTTAGLSDCLENGADPVYLIQRVGPLEIYLLSAGKPEAHPTELLQSDALPALMRTVRDRFDWVVVDSPPVQPLPDTLLLRQQTDATLLVVRAGHTPVPAVDEAVTLIGKKHILGMVLNGVEGLDRAYSKYYSSYGGDSKR